MSIEMDESEHNADTPAEWWRLLDDSESFIRFHYEDIQKYGSPELKQAVAIVLGGQPPAVYKRHDSA